MVLDIKTKILLMIEQLRLTKELLNDDCLRPKQRQKYQEEYDILKKDINDLLVDMYKIIKN